MTHDGIQLVNVGGTFSSWVWSCAVHPTASHIVSYNILFTAFLLTIHYLATIYRRSVLKTEQ